MTSVSSQIGRPKPPARRNPKRLTDRLRCSSTYRDDDDDDDDNAAE